MKIWSADSGVPECLRRKGIGRLKVRQNLGPKQLWAPVPNQVRNESKVEVQGK